MTWLFLLCGIAIEVTATLFLKQVVDQPLMYVPVIVAYTVSLVFLKLALIRGMSLGVAYGIWAASGLAATALLAAAIYDEQISLLTGVGLAMLTAGVLVLHGSASGVPSPVRDVD